MIGPEAFRDKVMPVPWSGCWLWIGARDRGGYGNFRLRGRATGAHRVAYEFAHGQVPEGLDLDHKCRVRCCVNPDHLEAVSHGENVRRGETGKHNADKTHCPHGHEYTAENTFYRKRKDGYRIRNCRECDRIEVRRYRARLRATACGLALGLLSLASAAQAEGVGGGSVMGGASRAAEQRIKLDLSVEQAHLIVQALPLLSCATVAQWPACSAAMALLAEIKRQAGEQSK